MNSSTTTTSSTTNNNKGELLLNGGGGYTYYNNNSNQHHHQLHQISSCAQLTGNNQTITNNSHTSSVKNMTMTMGHHSASATNLTNNNSNGGHYDDMGNNGSSKYHNHHHYPPPQWYDIDIKGLVKNISPKLWQWTHLSRLCLNDNNLIRLPPVVSNLVNLQYLDVSNNKIRTLPAEIGDMTCLRELYLNYNQLRVLPFELGKLFKLHQLGLKGNPLTTDIMQVYSEPNGTQKLLISLLDQLSITCTPPPRRPWMILAEPNPSLNSCIFTTMCYNVLCDKYATRQYYGYCPAWALAWDYRKKLIMEDIKNLNADIICLQELETEQFYQYFLPELKQCDYDGIFSAKSRAKTMGENEKKHVDGCAIFFKTTRFQLVKDYLIEFNQIAMAAADGSEDMLNRVMTKDNIGLAALLEVKQDNDSANGNNKENNNNSSPNQSPVSQNNTMTSGGGGVSGSNKQLLLVSTAHIHWDPEYCDVKLIQTLMLINELKTIIEQAMREFQPQRYMIAGGANSNNKSIDCSSCIPVVLCADLNSLPESGVIEYLRSGRILANHVDFKDMGYDSCLQKINTSDRPSELSHNLKLECAYDKDLIPYTNYTYDFKGMIDYIFYSGQLMRTVGLLGPLDSEWIKSNKIMGFPHPHVPSDHLPLMVELELINPNLTINNLNSYFGTSNNTSSTSSSSNNNNNSYQNTTSNNGGLSQRNGGGGGGSGGGSGVSSSHHHSHHSSTSHHHHSNHHNHHNHHHISHHHSSNNSHHHHHHHHHHHAGSSSKFN